MIVYLNLCAEITELQIIFVKCQKGIKSLFY